MIYDEKIDLFEKVFGCKLVFWQREMLKKMLEDPTKLIYVPRIPRQSNSHSRLLLYIFLVDALRNDRPTEEV